MNQQLKDAVIFALFVGVGLSLGLRGLHLMGFAFCGSGLYTIRQ